MTTIDMTTEPKRRTITLTGRPPVRISEAAWPTIAHGGCERADSPHSFQSNRTTEVGIRVRQHADGRAIVYGVYGHETRWQHERSATYRAGMLLAPGSDLVAAIRQVGAELQDRSVDDLCDAAVRACIADLPPVDL